METKYVTIEKSEYERLVEIGEIVSVQMDENAQLQAENKLLRDKVDLLVRRVFGSSSERFDYNQMLLSLGDDFEQALNEEDGSDDDQPDPPPKSRKKRTPEKDRLPDDLPEERITIIPEEVQANPDDYDRIGQEETVTLDFIPMSYKKVITVRPKYIKK